MIKCAACLREATQTVGDHVFCDNCAAINTVSDNYDEQDKQDCQHQADCDVILADHMNEDEHDR